MASEVSDVDRSRVTAGGVIAAKRPQAARNSRRSRSVSDDISALSKRSRLMPFPFTIGKTFMRMLQAGVGFRNLPLRRIPKGKSPVRSGAWPLARSRSEEHKSELQSIMRIPYAVFCLQKQ